MINSYHLLPEWQVPHFGALGRRHLDVNAGRGKVLLVEHPKALLAERTYRHGGLHRLFFPELFLKTDRAAKELESHRQVFQAGISTVEPVGWSESGTLLPFVRRYFYYSVYLADAQTLPSQLSKCLPRVLIAQMADTLAALFRLGIFHPDLNLNNWLVAGQKLHVIDFDKARSVKVDAFTYVLTVAGRIARSGKKLGFLGRKNAFVRLVVMTSQLLSVNARSVLCQLPRGLNRVGLVDRMRWALFGGHGPRS